MTSHHITASPTSDLPHAIDALTDRSPSHVMWTRVNAAEAAPGVLRPMTWSFYGHALEINTRRGFRSLGLLPDSALAYPHDPGDRAFGIFHGRFAVNVNVLRRIMSALPGVTGDDVERDLLGAVGSGIVDVPYPHRGRAVLFNAPRTLVGGRGQPAQNREDTQRWWADSVGTRGVNPRIDPQTLLRESFDRFGRSIRLQIWTRMIFQTMAAQLTALADRAGEPDAAASLMAGSASTEEAAVADDLWLLAQDRLSLELFLARHGYHGPNGGDPAARSWREDPAPLTRLLTALSAAEAPADRRMRVAAEREQVISRVVAALPRHQRPAGRALLTLGPPSARSLERTKTSFLIAIDGARAATRGIGRELCAAGLLDDPEDAFQLFAGELLAPDRLDLRALVDARHRLRERYLTEELPDTWQGQAHPHAASSAHDAETMVVTGLGVSPGVAEGPVRVVTDAADEIDVELGDILVCPITDPSWLALMTVAAALVIDIGAAASHGAIVARELGVPCVIGTKTGTTALRDGDYVRVDGSTGRVDVLRRAPVPPVR